MADKSLPYSEASSGTNALAELQKVLQRFNCQAFGSMMDYENKKLIVQFKHRGRPVTFEASIAGYAAAYVKTRPHNHRMKCTSKEYERKALEQAEVAVYSVLRDLIKAQVTMVECGIMSFEGMFLGQIMLPSGISVLDAVQDKGILKLEDKRNES